MMTRCPQCHCQILKKVGNGKVLALSNYTISRLVFEKKTHLQGAGGVFLFEDDENTIPKYSVTTHKITIPCCKDCSKKLDYEKIHEEIIQHTPQGKHMCKNEFKVVCCEEINRKSTKKVEGQA